MIFLGRFSFAGDGPNGPAHGHFVVLVDAAEPELALDAFRERIRATNRRARILSRGTRIWLDDVVELSSVPADGVLLGWVLADGTPPDTIALAVPTEVEGVRAFVLHDGDEDEPEPFLVIGKASWRARAAK